LRQPPDEKLVGGLAFSHEEMNVIVILRSLARMGPKMQKAQAATALGLALALSACGGGGGGSSTTTAPAGEPPASRAEAARFLNQATFGSNEAELNKLMASGYSNWIEDQWTKPRSTHRANWEAWEAAVKAVNSSNSIGQDGVTNSFWKAALVGEDQLRQRVAYALSQIFVVSLVDSAVANDPRAVAAYMDMLADNAGGNYRTLLEAVSRHPMMGTYLSHLRNQKADPRTGRVPDENYSREVMQLFSIGVHELQSDGRQRLVSGKPVDTYTPADISGLAKVFTGFSWVCPAMNNNCFSSGSSGGVSDPDRALKPMVGYPAFHSQEEKRFLGTVIPAQATANPDASLKTALDTLYNHANVGPFIGKQLIQRLVTSNPSPDYVAAVAATFNNNGQGVRGDMKAVVKAVLLHPQAKATSNTSGQLRDPLLRTTAFMRAYGFNSDTGNFRMGNTDNPGTALGMSPMRSPSVFNFFRPGYVPPGTQTAAAGLVSPEMQLAQETTAAGYVNFIRDAVAFGLGQNNGVVNGVSLNRRDLQGNFTADVALADKPADLVARANTLLLQGRMSNALRDEIVGAVSKMAIPALTSNGSNQAQVDRAKRARVNAALLLVLAAPEYQVTP
jgi:uncharacterized protein (DUF1800 family)